MSTRKMLDAGQRFGRLLVIRMSTVGVKWQCICECGNQCDVTYSNLISGSISSCGCLRKECLSRRAADRNRRRGSNVCFSGQKHPAYNSWSAMHTRCENRNRKDWPRYGGRGIVVCERWRVFENFVEDMPNRPYGTSIDRIDNDGNYEPGNCRWATPVVQRNNSSTVRKFDYRGERLTITQFSQKYNLRASLVRGRIRKGWDIKDAIEMPPNCGKLAIAVRNNANNQR